MSLNETVRSSLSRAGIVRVRNAMNPLLWVCAVAPTPTWIMAYSLRDDLILRYSFAALGAVPIIGTMIAYFIYMARDPDRLQSEEFILRQQELSLIERKGVAPLADEARGADDWTQSTRREADLSKRTER